MPRTMSFHSIAIVYWNTLTVPIQLQTFLALQFSDFELKVRPNDPILIQMNNGNSCEQLYRYLFECDRSDRTRRFSRKVQVFWTGGCGKPSSNFKVIPKLFVNACIQCLPKSEKDNGRFVWTRSYLNNILYITTRSKMKDHIIFV